MATFYTSNLVQTIRQNFSQTVPSAGVHIWYSMPSGYYGFIRAANQNAGPIEPNILRLVDTRNQGVWFNNDFDYNLNLATSSLYYSVNQTKLFSSQYPNGIYMNSQMAIVMRNNSSVTNFFGVRLDIDLYKEF